MKRIIFIVVILILSILDTSYSETGKVYTKSGLGYNFSNLRLNQKIANGDTSAIFKNTKQRNKLQGFDTEIGFGYSLCKNIRTEITINASQNKKKFKKIELISDIGKINIVVRGKNGNYSSNDGSIQKQSVILQEIKLGSMTNIYYDFYNTSELTPYIMAGLGIKTTSLASNISGYETGPNNNKLRLANEVIRSQNSKSFEYQVGVGSSYKILKNILIDISYKISNTINTYEFRQDDIEVGGILSNKGIENKEKFGTPKLQHNVTTGIRLIF